MLENNRIKKMTLKSKNNREQRIVDTFFDKNATYWRDTYSEGDIQGIIYRRRQTVALSYVDGLLLPKTSRVLEIGCGAGLLTRALARRGFAVEAIDSSEAMVNLTLQSATDANLDSRISAHKGDVHNLLYPAESFDLIVALGLVPWLLDFNKALLEIIRVLRPGGFIVLTMDNARRATTLLDPSTFPAIEIIVGIIRRKLQKAGLLTINNLWLNCPTYRRYTPREFINILLSSGLNIVESASVGFGPFTFLGHNIFPESLGVKINYRLQEYADNRYPILRSTGAQYIVLATKKRKLSN